MEGKTTLSIAADHPAFDGHFPGRPILPGVVLLDAAVHVLTQTMRASTGDRQALCQISSAKFLSPVSPGEILTITCTGTASGSTRFEISCESRKVASGTLAWVPVP